jgi:hypothetical protein
MTPRLLDEKPIYCMNCGDKLKEFPTIEYDPQTGARVNKGVFLVMCSSPWWFGGCFTRYALCTTGQWKEV